MRRLFCVIMIGSALTGVSAQSGFTGTWREERPGAGVMGPRGDSVATVPGAHALPRKPVTEVGDELTIAEDATAVTVEAKARGVVRRVELPLSGLSVRQQTATGPELARAYRDGSALVLSAEQQVSLPGGSVTTITTVQRHVLLPDGRLAVDTTRSATGRRETSRVVFVRVP